MITGYDRFLQTRERRIALLRHMSLQATAAGDYPEGFRLLDVVEAIEHGRGFFAGAVFPNPSTEG